jgi:tetratricopeptide (TPR) repeat protein
MSCCVRARFLAATGDLPGGIATVRKVIAIDPLYAWGWTLLAAYDNANGQPKLARDAAARALGIAPDQIFATRELGIPHLLRGDSRGELAVFAREKSEVLRLTGTAAAQHDLGDVDSEMNTITVLRGRFAESGVYEIALAYAWRGDRVNRPGFRRDPVT